MNNKNQYSSESESSNSTNLVNEESKPYGSKSGKSYYSENIDGDLNIEDSDKYKKGKPVRSIIKARLIK